MSFVFFRWVRFGIAAALTDATLPLGGGPRAKVGVDVGLAATVPVFGPSAPLPTAALSVFGPGDVSGLDGRQVVRTFPAANTGDFESSYYAHIELDRPDLPWLFTPVAPDSDHRLRPWLGLVVVERRDGVELRQAAPLPVLSIADRADDELPALDEAAEWAHVQVSGGTVTDLEALARDEPERILSRIICPRQLRSNTAYLACLVPTYDVGVAAGLGAEVRADATIGPAWTPTTTTIQLPVFYHWEFATSAGGDFRSLVTRLQAHAPGPTMGTRPLDISRPRYAVADLPAGVTAGLGGALRVTAGAAAPVSPDLAQRLLPVLAADDTVGPPVYGRWHAATSSLSLANPIGWLDALNLDPRHRVAAGIGTRVVQERQEDLMAAVWEQFGAILEANQRLRQAQLAIAAAERIVNRHLAAQPDGVLLGLVGPAAGRIRTGAASTLSAAVRRSCLPTATLSGAFRRIVRTHGPLERRIAHRTRTGMSDVMPPPSIDVPTLVDALAAGTLDAAPATSPDGALVAPAAIFGSDRRRFPVGRGQSLLPADLQGPLAALLRRATVTPCTPLDVGALAQTVRDALVPDVAIPPRVLAQIELPGTDVVLSDRLDPVMASPVIPTPMVTPLIEQGQDLLLPGLADLPPNSLAMVEPNAEFIESYFVGLNHEMGRELLWRGFPTDQRGTVFARFWDRRGAVPDGGAPADDIVPIATWLRTEALGSHLTRSASDVVILLIRGDLLQRYPTATIFMQRARWSRDATGAIIDDDGIARRQPEPLTDAASWARHGRHPAFTGRAGGEIAFNGFMVPRSEVRGRDRTRVPAGTSDDDAGWYVVFQEQPTEPRFGPGVAAPLAVRAETLAAELIRPAFRLFVHASDLVAR